MTTSKQNAQQPDVLISVIVPVYNTADRLRKTLYTLDYQTCKDFDVIIVDDGSEDGSDAIIHAYCNDPKNRARAFFNAHGGVGAARNKGLDEAKGKYIWFVDSDDTLPEKAMAFMKESAENGSPDMICGIQRKNSTFSKSNYRRTVELAKKETIDRYDLNLIHSFSLNCKLFRREIIEENHLRFKDYKHAEDAVFLFEFLNHAQTITGCDHIIYRYYRPVHGFGTTTLHQPNAEQLEDFLRAAAEICELNSGGPESFTDELNYRILNTSLISGYYRRTRYLAEDAVPLLKDAMQQYADRLSAEKQERLVSHNRDLRLDLGFIDEAEMDDNPVFAIVCTHHGDGDMNAFKESLRHQDAPFFRLYEAPVEEWGRIIEETPCEVILFTDDRTRFDSDTLSALYRQMNRDEVDAASGYYCMLDNGKIKESVISNFLFEDDSAFAERLDSLLFNKLFRVSSLREKQTVLRAHSFCNGPEKLTVRRYKKGILATTADEQTLMKELRSDGAALYIEGTESGRAPRKGTAFDLDQVRGRDLTLREKMKKNSSEYLTIKDAPGEEASSLKIGQKLVPFADIIGWD